MHDKYTDQELVAQLQQDLAEGESWHIEFKAYNHMQLDSKADLWKDDLAHEIAAFASIGGKIYIGIGDDGTLKGIGNSHQTWHEKLFERAVGRIKPKVNWKSYYFADSATGLSLIRIDVLEGEPIYYVMGKPYIRDGTMSRPAEPEEVKARWKDRVSSKIPQIKIRDPKAGEPVMLQLIDTGKELMAVLAHALATHYDNPEPRSTEEAELIGEFFQNITDYTNVWSDIELSGRIETEFWFSGEITRLREAGLVVYASKRNHVLEGGIEPPTPWPVAYIYIRRSDE